MLMAELKYGEQEILDNIRDKRTSLQSIKKTIGSGFAGLVEKEKQLLTYLESVDLGG